MLSSISQLFDVNFINIRVEKIDRRTGRNRAARRKERKSGERGRGLRGGPAGESAAAGQRRGRAPDLRAALLGGPRRRPDLQHPGLAAFSFTLS